MQVRSSMHFEGWRYSLGDFTVCVGRGTLKPKQEFRGFVVEIHYHPLNDLTMGQGILAVRAVSCSCKQSYIASLDSKHALCLVMRSSIKLHKDGTVLTIFAIQIQHTIITAFMKSTKQQRS